MEINTQSGLENEGICAKLRRVVIAPDSFKESMPALEVAAAIARGVKRYRPEKN